MIKPIDNFSFQYSEEEYSLLDYIYPVAQEYAPDFDYNVSDCSTTSCVFDFLLRCTPL